ncbi:Calcium homeostasis endoplasmic reticulum protein [Liparis tanakae]|uniref:Calcium homeostasis endoplasmic reticulum protein n=1 Tax=Liparis tanakae TaxID=230148 RepID=A0A4Z2H9N2_9TELE|nr:Calcium homeostasis endoplasmic reticulum protein [Liparis tanakae]
MDIPNAPEDQELRNVIDKLAQFVARNGPEFEKMTMEKQKDNPKFSFLFGGEYFSYYKCKLTMEHQQQMYNPGAKDVVDIPPPSMSMTAPPPIPSPALPSLDELIQQSQWNLQQQEQHLHTLRQEQVTAAIALAMEQQTQKMLIESQLDITEFDNLLQPIIDTCTKDAISAGKNWMFNNAKTPQHCELMTSHLRNRITADGAHFELRLHLIYLTNDVLHHCQRKQQKDLLAALQKVVVPIYCTSFLAVEEEKQQKITRLLQLWEKNGYFDEETIQQLQNPALGLGQYQLAFQQQSQALNTQHEEFIATLKQQQQPQLAPVAHLAPLAEHEKAMPMTTKAGDVKPTMSVLLPGEFDGASSRPQDPSNPSGPSDITSNKPAWYDTQHLGPWNPNQPPPFDPNQPPPPCPPWNSHEGMWNEQRDPGNWSGGPPREGGPWSGPEGPSLLTSSHLLSTSLHHLIVSDGFHHALCRMTFLPDTTMTGPRTPHTTLTMLKEIILQVWGLIILPGVEASTQILPNPHMASMATHPKCVIVSSQCKMTPVWCQMYPTLTCQLLEDYDYKPLDPKDIRLPPPMPPSDRLLAAVEAFYSPPSHDRPRNSEGWEQNGLYEFFRAKMRARRKKGQEKRNSSSSVVAAPPTKPSADNRLGEENKGHQLLMKMGWSGSGGLGAKEQGIQDPIKGGDVRDKWDQFKGVGVSLDDPYENYRRNKSYNFVARMKAREEVNREPQEPPPTD